MASKQTKSNASNWPGTKGKWTRDGMRVTESPTRIWLFESKRAAKRFVRSGNPREGKLIK